MKKTQYYFRMICMLSLFFLMNMQLMAASGKLSGTVTDKDTGEPLIGVNIIVHELQIGASSDIDGRFMILNIPPGYYTVSASYMGYQKLTFTDVRFSMDHTTVQDYKMSSQILEGDEVLVVAKRPLVQKDLTSSQRVTSAEEIKSMPVESFYGVLTTQAGVNEGADGAIHIRGGRSNEVGYYIDGVSVATAFSSAISISNQSLEEMKVVSGAFNAEYGNAMSGIVNIQLKEGGDKFKGNLSFYTGDRISKNNDIFPNIDDFSMSANTVFEGGVTGPIIGRKLTFNVSGKMSSNEGYYYGIREHLPSDSANFSDSDNYYVEMNGDSAYVAMNPSSSVNGLLKLTLRLTPTLKISTQTLYYDGQYKNYTHTYKFNPNGTYNNYSTKGGNSIRMNHSLGKMFYEISIYENHTEFKKYVYETLDEYKDVSTSKIIGSPASATFLLGGAQMDNTHTNSQTYGMKWDMTTQIGQHHETKMGIDIKNDKLNSDSYTILYDGLYFREPTVLDTNGSPTHSYYEGDADFASAYIQDKLEYESMIMNVGIRYDYFNPNSDYPINLLDPTGERETAPAKVTVSPRLGVAFPITDKGILHFSYGHFYQLPSLSNLYSYRVFGAGTSPTIGYADLKPEKTVIYEFGLQQQFGEYIALEATAFYKDIRNLLATQSIYYESSQYGPSSYALYLNKDYGTVKGFTISLAKPYDRSSHISGHFDYTYQETEGNNVSSGSFYFSQFSEEEAEKEIVILGWDQSHLLNTTVTYSISGNWSVSMIGKLASGWPYTPLIAQSTYLPISNSERKPWQTTIDMRANKTIKIAGRNFNVFLKVFNVPDFLNQRYVYDDTGSSAYTFISQSTEETKEFIRHYGEPGIHTWSEYQVRPTYYSSPRSAYLGFSVDL
jgi:outer membrane receptor protein involved in Fe transport